jgi:hypothetical protein
MEKQNENVQTIFKICQLYEHVNSGAAGLHVFYKYVSRVIINTLKCHILNVRLEQEYITKSYDCEQFRASAAKKMRSALVWDITLRVVAISYRRFGTIYKSQLLDP